MDRLIYKILPEWLWFASLKQGLFTGAEVDLADGYIHFSTRDTVKETAAKHFAGQDDLMLVAFEEKSFEPPLKWDPSRGGQLFPHLYGAVKPDTAHWAEPLLLDDDGKHIFPDLEA